MAVYNSKVRSASLFVCKRSIYDEHKPATTNAKSILTSKSETKHTNREYQYTLQFPVSIARNIFCVEAKPNKPVLIVITTLGQIYTLDLDEIEENSRGNNVIHNTYIQADINSSIVTIAIDVNDEGVSYENDGFAICLCCTNGYLYRISLFVFASSIHTYNKHIYQHFDFRISKTILNRLVPNFIYKLQEHDSVVDACYLTHKLVITMTRSNTLRVLNLQDKETILEYSKLTVRNPEKDFYRVKALQTNPYITKSNGRINFLVCLYVANSFNHREVKLFNLSFPPSGKNGLIEEITEIPSFFNIGVDPEFTDLGEIIVEDMITHVDANNHGILITTLSYEGVEDRIVYHRFDKKTDEKLGGFESVLDEVQSRTESRRKAFMSHLDPLVIT